MKAGWETKNLGTISTINYGYTESACSDPVGPHFLRITDIQNDQVDWSIVPFCKIDTTFQSKFLLTTGDIVFARTGATTGKSYLVTDPPDSVFASYLIRLRLSDKSLLPEFIAMFFQTSGYWKSIQDGVAGSAQGGFNASKLAALRISFPPLPEQQRIVAILDEAFDGIATAKANAEKNLLNARALFESHLNAVFSQRGEGCKRSTIGDQMMLQRGFDITKDEQKPGKVPVVSSGGIKSFHDKAMVHAPGVVIGRKGTLGKVFYLEADYWPHDTTLWVKDFKGNNPRFVYYLFTGLDVKKLDSGTANPALNRNLVHLLEVNWPPVDQQKAIVVTLDAMSEETQRLEAIYRQKLSALDALKKSLLDQAFTGRL